MKKVFINTGKMRKGYIAVTVVLLVSIILIGIAVTVSQLAIGEGQSVLAMSKSESTLMLVEGCVEDALMNVQKNSSYTGIKVISRPEGTCSVQIANNAGTWTATAVNTNDTTYVRTIQTIFTRGGNITISSWLET